MWPSLMVHCKCFDCKSYIFLLYDKSTDRNLCFLHFFSVNFTYSICKRTDKLHVLSVACIQSSGDICSDDIFQTLFFPLVSEKYNFCHFSNFISIHIMFQIIFHIFSSWLKAGKLQKPLSLSFCTFVVFSAQATICFFKSVFFRKRWQTVRLFSLVSNNFYE